VKASWVEMKELMKKYLTKDEDVKWVSYEEVWPEAWTWDKLRFKPLIREEISNDWNHLRLIRAELDPGESHRLHHHPQPAFYYILKGKAKLVLGDEETEAGPGTVMYIPSHVKHEITNIGKELLSFLGCETPHSPTDFVWDMKEMRNIKRSSYKRSKNE